MRIVLMVSVIVVFDRHPICPSRRIRTQLCNFLEENLRGLEPNVAILAENRNYDWTEAIKILRPKTVIVHHYDGWRVALSSGMTAAVRRRAQRLERELKSVERNIKVIIPEFLQTIPLE
ncbi:MAG TPA: hypothetical protein VIE89_16170 [Candidatus Binatia bacterium]|jgi:hypothetical protein